MTLCMLGNPKLPSRNVNSRLSFDQRTPKCCPTPTAIWGVSWARSRAHGWEGGNGRGRGAEEAGVCVGWGIVQQ